jgi:SAM-dependent methyltransferase
MTPVYEIIPNGDGFALLIPSGEHGGRGPIYHFDTREDAEAERDRFLGIPHAVNSGVRIMVWNREPHVTHALVSGIEGTHNWHVHKGARSLKEAQLYLSNYQKYGDYSLAGSEVSKYLHLLEPYLERPCLDLGSGGYAVTDFAIQIELPSDEFNKYTAGRKPDHPIHIHGDIFNLPFKDGTVGSIVASHLIEDWPRSKWPEFFREWKRCLRPGGHLIVLVPERELWWHCINTFGQCHNFSHSDPEPSLGDIAKAAEGTGLKVISEALTECFDFDYSILGVLQA